MEEFPWEVVESALRSWAAAFLKLGVCFDYMNHPIRDRITPKCLSLLAVERIGAPGIDLRWFHWDASISQSIQRWPCSGIAVMERGEDGAYSVVQVPWDDETVAKFAEQARRNIKNT